MLVYQNRPYDPLADAWEHPDDHKFTDSRPVEKLVLQMIEFELSPKYRRLRHGLSTQTTK